MKKEKTIKILKISASVFSCLMLLSAAFFTIFFFAKGIHLSLFEDDIKTAQNRIRSAYAFLKMLVSGLVLICYLVLFFKFKNYFIPLNIQEKIGISDEK